MPDRRSVDNLGVEELERIIRERKRQARLARLRGEQIAPQPRVKVPWRTRLLPMIELTIVLAAALVGLNIWHTLSRSNAALRLSGAGPTATATALIQPVILPASHRPPPGPGRSVAPTSDILENLLVLATSPVLPVLNLPTPEPVMAVRITIPAIGVDAPVVHGVEWEQLKLGVGHVPNTGLPGDTGNVVLARTTTSSASISETWINSSRETKSSSTRSPNHSVTSSPAHESRCPPKTA